MTNTIRFTLVADGSSDAVLVDILNWLMHEHIHQYAIDGVMADFRQFQKPPANLSERIQRAIDLFPCDLLFIHRDAENQTIDARVSEIHTALKKAKVDNKPLVCVVPVRMQEAWLLIEEHAIRQAAGNPNGKEPLNLPDIHRLESTPDPKNVLHEALRKASGLSGRRLDRFNPHREVHRIVDYVEGFSILRQLTAFQRLEKDLTELIEQIGWN